MIQIQALNYIIANNDIELLTTYDEKYYFNYTDEYKFILKHYHEYKSVPEITSVLGKFPEFTPWDVKESRDYIMKTLHEEFVFNSAVEILYGDKAKSTLKKGLKTDAVKAVNNLISSLQDLKPPSMSYGTDIIKEAPKRYEKLIDKMEHKEDYLFSTGLNELDIILNGGLRRGEELLVIYARTNNAKTWVAEKVVVSVWEQGYNVGFFSPEMSAESVGYRFDTLFKHFDNHGIQGDDARFDTEPYRRYVYTLASKKRPIFNVVTKNDLLKQFPDGITVTAIKNWIIANDLKAIVLDGMQYLKNERGGHKKNTTENLTDISEDLMSLSQELHIPIIAVLQANRTGARDADGEVSTESPELDTIRGSDGISHNASRAISIYKAKDVIKLYLSKNRYGEKGQHLYYHYDVNTGTFTYTPNPKDGLPFDTTIAESFDDKGSVA